MITKEMTQLTELSINLGVEIARQLMPRLLDSGALKTNHTYAVGFACGGAYGALVALNGGTDMPVKQISRVLAEGFEQAMQSPELSIAIIKILTDQLGPPPWNGEERKS